MVANDQQIAPSTAFSDLDRELIDKTLYFVADRAWRVTDTEFFYDLVKFLGETFGVAYAFCDLIDPTDDTSVTTLALYAHGEITENISYPLKDTPCENVVGRSICCYVDKVQQLFPRDQLLVDMKAESYAGIPLWSADGKPLGLVAIIDDKPLGAPELIKRVLQIVATRAGGELDRMQGMEQLRKSERRFADFAAISSDWFWEMDGDLRFSYFSDSFEEMTGIPKDTLLGKTRGEAGIPGVKPDLMEDFLARLNGHQQLENFEHPRILPSGKQIWISVNGTPTFTELGEFTGYRGTGTDITAQVRAKEALQKSELLFRTIYENASVGITVSDIHGSPTNPNDAYCAMVGIDRSKFPGVAFQALVHPEDLPENVRLFNEMKRGQRETYELVKRYLHKDGTIVWVRSNVIKLPEGNFGDSYAVTLNEDITTLLETQKGFKDALVDAERANQAKSEFLASMSHELRTPMNAVLGFAQMLTIDPANPLTTHQNGYVENIVTGGTHLLKLINEVLDLSRIEADQLELSLDKVNANEVVSECIELVFPLGNQREIRTFSRFNDGAPTFVFTDSDRFKQILLNLLSNAVKFNKDGGRVTVEGHETEYGYFRISIADTGIGIPPEECSSVFKLFHSCHVDPMIASEGTGIGLSVCKLLTERMAGRIGFESEVGLGSVFWFELPLASNDDVLIWTDAIRVNVDALDNDHQILVSLLNRLMHSSPGNENDIVDELLDFVPHHFKREEAIMEFFDYAGIEKHRAIHDKLLANLSEQISAWRGKPDRGSFSEICKFVRGWLINHILNDDAKLAFLIKGRDPEIRRMLEESGLSKVRLLSQGQNFDI